MPGGERLFWVKLSGMIGAGVGLVAAVESLVVEEGAEERREILEQVLQDLRAGRSLAEALGERPQLFGTEVTALVAMGERDGRLAEAARAIADRLGGPAAGPGDPAPRAAALLQSAWSKKASDIHLDPDERGSRVRFRLDGVLVLQERLDPRAHVELIDEIKRMACLDLEEKGLPQDGRIRIRIGEGVEGGALDARVGIDPCVFGEAATLRLMWLDETREILRNPESIFPEVDLRVEILQAARRPHGLFVITGPVDSGKTTTAYSLLSIQDVEKLKIMTVEEPVELVLPGVHQAQARPWTGLTLAAALRGMLRRDPDILYCAEVRDADTAWLLARAALTGHMVFTSLHAGTSDAAVMRLIDVGVERYVLADCLAGVLAQRLVRLVCPECRRPDPGGPERLRSQGGEADGATVYEATGCTSCHGTGYRGRRALHELLPMTPSLRRTLHETEDRAALQRALEDARRGTLRQHGLRLVARGVTTLAEIERVVPPA